MFFNEKQKMGFLWSYLRLMIVSMFFEWHWSQQVKKLAGASECTGKMAYAGLFVLQSWQSSRLNLNLQVHRLLQGSKTSRSYPRLTGPVECHDTCMSARPKAIREEQHVRQRAILVAKINSNDRFTLQGTYTKMRELLKDTN